MLHRSLLLSILPLFFSSLTLAKFDCAFNIGSHHFNLVPLKGVHTASTTVKTPPTTENTTVFIDLCQDLHWDSDLYDSKDRCEDGTQGSSKPEWKVIFSMCYKIHSKRR